MEFVSIFTAEEEANLWPVCYPEHVVEGVARDIFSLQFDLWSNTDYLRAFFMNNRDLKTPFWSYLSLDQAIDKVLDEREQFEAELFNIENKVPGYKGRDLKTIFKPLHKNIYSIHFENEFHRKAKPNFFDPIIRIYAVELSDGTMIITGGVLKLTEKMVGDQFDAEFKNLKSVQEYLKREGIDSKAGLFY
ncbi:MAG: hypothetical protein KGM98_00945 [Bacteroidota bacterium]|nr:hypothetical protein [Bacteroidota bacterium]